MRRKFAKRTRREILRRGVTINSAGWVKEATWMPGGRAYYISAQYNGIHYRSWERDELSAYRQLLKEVLL